MQDTDLHNKLLELSDAVGRLNKRILGHGETNLDLCFDARALIEEYDARLDEIRNERMRRNRARLRNANEQEPSSAAA